MVPVIETLAADGATVSVDTMRAEVAEQAARPRARRSSTTSPAGSPTRAILDVVARRPRSTYVAMHWRGAQRPDAGAHDVRRPGWRRRGRAPTSCARGSTRPGRRASRDDRIVLDPGLGFAKTAEQNWELLGRLDEIAGAGLPAAGRGQPQVVPRRPAGRRRRHAARPVDEREARHTPRSPCCWPRQGVWGVRVHDVRASPRRAASACERLAGGRTMTTSDRRAERASGIECCGHHGVFEHERRDGQPFVIDLTLGLDTAPAAASDDLRDTVDYGSLVAEVKAAVETDPVDLIETLAQRIADVCLLDARVEWAAGHGAQAGRAHRGDVRRRDADDHPTPTPDSGTRGPTVTETPNPNIIDADTLTGEMRPIRRAVRRAGIQPRRAAGQPAGRGRRARRHP